MSRREINGARVYGVWKPNCPCGGTEVDVALVDITDTGIPICPECGEDMEYSRAEICGEPRENAATRYARKVVRYLISSKPAALKTAALIGISGTIDLIEHAFDGELEEDATVIFGEEAGNAALGVYPENEEETRE
jgi:hypothetical protein